MASNPKIEFFKGSNWEECIAFIQAIRAAAWAECKIRDPAWMADFSSLYFSHKSLSWHSKLPIEVRQDWFKLEAALVDRWAPDDEDDSSYIQPVPAAAPKSAGGGGNSSLLYGVLKVVPGDDSAMPQYIKFNGGGICRLTKDREAALQVSFNSRSKSGLLEWTGGSQSSWLVIHWPYSKVPERSGFGSASYAYLAIVSARDLKSSWSYTGGWQLMESSASPKGEFTPTWKGVDNSEISLCVFWSGEDIYLAPDSETFSQTNPAFKRGKLGLDPIN